MNKSNKFRFLDSLYGDISLSEPLTSLLRLPVVQRLRHVRLSNIDSLSSPGVAGISRYEHSLGVAFLALKTGLIHSLNELERTCFLAAALLHDTAITPYGHLVEEAMQYLEENVEHEEKWALLLSDSQTELGGVDLQIYCGRESGLRNWAFKIFEQNFEQALDLIFKTIKGNGPLGECIRGNVDLDNLDNVPRAAYHMGIQVDKELPIRIAQGINITDDHENVFFSEKVILDFEAWLDLRREVYNRFMLSEVDFTGKIMIISATISALEHNIFRREDWKLPDNTYIEKLFSCEVESVRDPIRRWLLGDLWNISNLIWIKGKKPDYSDLLRFSKLLSKEIRRECLAYGIQDKRTRAIVLSFHDREPTTLGHMSDKWLLCVGSPKKEPFRSHHNRAIISLAKEHFGWQCLPDSYEQDSFPLF